jgi:hypothetical protein
MIRIQFTDENDKTSIYNVSFLTTRKGANIAIKLIRKLFNSWTDYYEKNH